MALKFYNRDKIKRTTRFLLFVFVASWINLAFQAPLHAAMKNDRMQAEEAGVMNCHCPPPLCDTVLSYADDQSIDGIQNIHPDLLSFHGMVIDNNTTAYDLNIKFTFFEQQFRETSPPPLLLKTVLLI